MRICFISSYPPNRARLSEYAQNLITELSKKHSIKKIYVIADKIEGKNKDIPYQPNVSVLRVWKSDNLLSILNILLLLLKLKPDVVHFNVHFQSWGKSRIINFTGMSLILISKLLGFKVVAEIHNLGEKVDLEKVQLKPTALNKLGIFLATKLILSAPKVIVTVKSYASYLTNRYGHKNVQYIPHGTHVKVLTKTDSSEKVILIFGHMGPYKGLPVLFQAFKELYDAKYPISLIVAGTSHPNFPNYLDSFKTVNMPGVKFLGYVPEENLDNVFKKADVVVIPYSTTTGTSGVFHLACGFGVPIIASKLPEIQELIAQGSSAVLVKPGDVNDLKKAILSIIFDNKKAIKMRKTNLEFAKKESWNIIAQSFENVYRQLQKQ